VKIADIIENILRGRQWAIYDRQNPLEKLNVSGEAPLFKVNEVELKYLIDEIDKAMKEEQWKKSNSDGSQENTSQNG
tara:strand:+ start:110 stop:340 length:231 start_codon:yes stop_codon:yes gene_type:complete